MSAKRRRSMSSILACWSNLMQSRATFPQLAKCTGMFEAKVKKRWNLETRKNTPKPGLLIYSGSEENVQVLTLGINEGTLLIHTNPNTIKNLERSRESGHNLYGSQMSTVFELMHFSATVERIIASSKLLKLNLILGRPIHHWQKSARLSSRLKTEHSKAKHIEALAAKTCSSAVF